MDEGASLIVGPGPLVDEAGERQATVQALVRTGRSERGFTYAPVVVKNAEVVEPATTRRILLASLDAPAPSEARWSEGFSTRSSLAVTRAGLTLAHATRVLETLGHADPGARGAIVDRRQRVWWLELAGDAYPRHSLETYDRLYAERLEVIRAHERWRQGAGPFPTTPYWHRECPDCPFSSTCERTLEARDDVSLTRFTSWEQQVLLREHGVSTRTSLAALDPARARAARHRAPGEIEGRPEDHLGRAIDKLDDLIYRARAHLAGEPLRAVEASAMGCPTAEVEVDVDMESYHDRTYLWGAVVRLRRPVAGLEEGYRAFAEWGPLDAESEGALFGRFWTWFRSVRDRAAEQGASFAAYCFWAQAEDGAMNRAVASAAPGAPSIEELKAFRDTAGAWNDLHELAQRQIQTSGPAGLKVLAQAAGFHWRDATPSGEASMGWYEVAREEGEQAQALRERLLAYNEDDCRATQALRDWLNGPARALGHRDDWGAPAEPR